MRAGGDMPLKIQVHEGVHWTQTGKTPTETQGGVEGRPVGEDRTRIQTGMRDGFSGVVSHEQCL